MDASRKEAFSFSKRFAERRKKWDPGDDERKKSAEHRGEGDRASFTPDEKGTRVAVLRDAEAKEEREGTVQPTWAAERTRHPKSPLQRVTRYLRGRRKIDRSLSL